VGAGLRRLWLRCMRTIRTAVNSSQPPKHKLLMSIVDFRPMHFSSQRKLETRIGDLSLNEDNGSLKRYIH
jgi:hypothetical protein